MATSENSHAAGLAQLEQGLPRQNELPPGQKKEPKRFVRAMFRGLQWLMVALTFTLYLFRRQIDGLVDTGSMRPWAHLVLPVLVIGIVGVVMFRIVKNTSGLPVFRIAMAMCIATYLCWQQFGHYRQDSEAHRNLRPELRLLGAIGTDGPYAACRLLAQNPTDYSDDEKRFAAKLIQKRLMARARFWQTSAVGPQCARALREIQP